MTYFDIKLVPGGGITTPMGFSAGAVAAGIKKDTGVPDLGLLHSDKPCSCAGLFTKNLVKAAPVLVSRERVASGKAQALVANSGCANACTGPEGEEDARAMAKLASSNLGISDGMVLVASTGVIGQKLPMDRIASGLRKVKLSSDGGPLLARAIMTTDTFPKQIAFRVEFRDFGFGLGGIAKGAGMIHPDMATMLCFLTTDAAIESHLLQTYLKQAVDQSLNMVTVDGDTSTNDMVVILANGQAGGKKIIHNTAEARAFSLALTGACQFLAKEIARDGEGATRLIQVQVVGARNVLEARKAARTVASSNLVKTAVYGADPNWGRVVAALGRSGAKFQPSQLDVHIDDICLMKDGRPQGFDKAEASSKLREKEVTFKVNLNAGHGRAVAWGCDLTGDYVTINSAYTT